MDHEGPDGRIDNRPPRGTRFGPGRSGNPRGRPKNSSVDLREILERESGKLVAAEGKRGRTMCLTKAEAAARQMVEAALQGDDKAIRVVLELASKFAPADAPADQTVLQVSWMKPDV